MPPTTAQGRAGWDALRAAPTRSLIALDYDGTLAPVVDDPAQALPAPGAVAVLEALAARGYRLALVTGRPADVVVRLAGVGELAGLVVLGQYGLQRWQAGALQEPEQVPGLELLRRLVPPVLEAEGAVLEDKGLSLVVHTRRSPDPQGAQQRLRAPLAALAERAGVEVHLGRLVLELRPVGADKGGALLSLVGDGGTDAVLFAGDDLGDLPAFAAVGRLRERGIAGLTVASGSVEGPSVLREQADVVVDGPSGVVALLRALATPG